VFFKRIGFVAIVSFVFACSATPPVSEVSIAPTVISPNADGKDDLARISYRVNSATRVSIYVTDSKGQRYDLRSNEQRSASPVAYELLFNGISGGKLLPNGDYVWHLDSDANGNKQTFSGNLKIENGDAALPEIKDFTLSTHVFSPNRDAIDDRIRVNLFLTKPAKLSVYVVGANGFRYEVPRREGLLLIPPGDNGTLPAGRYDYDYDGGIDLGADPPPNGIYTLYASAEDQIGQSSTISTTFEITQSGRPVGEIVIQPDGRGVEWSKNGALNSFAVGDTVYFTVTVRNTGIVPLRTAGPFEPNDCYAMEQNWYTKGFQQEPGVWRVGADFETDTGVDHPWRWGIGTLADLDIVMHNGDKLYYLAPGKQTVVRGCIKLTKVPVRNPFSIWASLIQEEVDSIGFKIKLCTLQNNRDSNYSCCWHSHYQTR
jgi:hypothetical protein